MCYRLCRHDFYHQIWLGSARTQSTVASSPIIKNLLDPEDAVPKLLQICLDTLVPTAASDQSIPLPVAPEFETGLTQDLYVLCMCSLEQCDFTHVIVQAMLTNNKHSTCNQCDDVTPDTWYKSSDDIMHTSSDDAPRKQYVGKAFLLYTDRTMVWPDTSKLICGHSPHPRLWYSIFNSGSTITYCERVRWENIQKGIRCIRRVEKGGTGNRTRDHPHPKRVSYH